LGRQEELCFSAAAALQPCIWRFEMRPLVGRNGRQNRTKGYAISAKARYPVKGCSVHGLPLATVESDALTDGLLTGRRSHSLVYS
jgi:hypothetical protein